MLLDLRRSFGTGNCEQLIVVLLPLSWLQKMLDVGCVLIFHGLRHLV